MMLNRGYAYKRAAIKTAQSILHQKIGNTYEIFHGEWFSFEDFKATNTVERLWERFIEYSRAYTENDNLLIGGDKIGPPETMRKNEIVIDRPIIPNITKTDQLVLDSFLNIWYKAVNSI